MIYLPRRAVFIHVPRTGGNSITAGLAGIAAGRGHDILLSTAGPSDGWLAAGRHSTALEMHGWIHEWDSIFKFAVYRPLEERLESARRLIRRDRANGVANSDTCMPGWRAVLDGGEEAEERLIAEWRRHDWKFFTRNVNGDSLGVTKIDFDSLQERWPEILDRCKLPYGELPHLNSGI